MHHFRIIFYHNHLFHNNFFSVVYNCSMIHHLTMDYILENEQSQELITGTFFLIIRYVSFEYHTWFQFACLCLIVTSQNLTTVTIQFSKEFLSLFLLLLKNHNANIPLISKHYEHKRDSLLKEMGQRLWFVHLTNIK